MIISRTDLQKTLRTLTNFDTSACPFVAVQMVGDVPKFYRAGNAGIVQSTEYSSETPSTYISLSHISDILRNIPDDKLEMYKDSKGILRIDSLNTSYHANFFVHTVNKDHTGMKSHILGNTHQVTLDKTSFSGINISPFQQSKTGEPVLVGGRLMIPMQTGVIFWDGNESLKPIQISPRAAFLRLIGGAPLEELSISDKGYWRAVMSSGLSVYIFGHIGNRGLFDEYNAPGTELAELPANQLMYALGVSSSLCGASNRVDIDPKAGVIFKDPFGESSSIGIGSYTTFHKFGLYSQMAKTIADAFAQTDEEVVSLSSVPTKGTPIVRFRRGAFEVNVRVLK